MKSALLFLALCLAPGLSATPTRVSVLDNGHLLVPDDWDGAMNYALAPNFKNRAYVDVDQGRAMGWGFWDLSLGTLVLWWNNPYEGAPLYSGLVQKGAGLGLLEQGIGSLSAIVPAELSIRVPENKVALGWAMVHGSSLSTAWCLRWARGEERRDVASSDAGGPLSLGSSTAAYMTGGTYPGMGVSAASNAQLSDGLILSPQFEWRADAWSLDGKGEIGFNRIENEHRESVLGAIGRGELRQTLRDKGRLSYGGTARLRYQLSSDSTLTLRGAWGRRQQGLERRLWGKFSGVGLTTAEAAGFDHADKDLELMEDRWEAWAAMLQGGGKGRTLMILALGAQGGHSASETRQWSPANTALSFNNPVLTQRQTQGRDDLSFPLLLGLEAEVRPWLLARSMVQRNLWQWTGGMELSDTFATSGALTQRQRKEQSSSVDNAWVFGMGFGLQLGQLQWDLALQSSWLGATSTTALSQPFLRSTWAYAF